MSCCRTTDLSISLLNDGKHDFAITRAQHVQHGIRWILFGEIHSLPDKEGMRFTSRFKPCAPFFPVTFSTNRIDVR